MLQCSGAAWYDGGLAAPGCVTARALISCLPICHACFAAGHEAGEEQRQSTWMAWGGIEVKEDDLSCLLIEELVAVNLLWWLLIGSPINGFDARAKIDGEAARSYRVDSSGLGE